MVRIVKYGCEGSWGVISSYDDTKVTITDKVVEFSVEYTVNTTDLSVKRKFIVTDDNDEAIWEGDSIDERDEYNNPYLVGFDMDDFDSSETKGHISGRKIMTIYHYFSVRVYAIDDLVSDTDE